MFPVGPLRAERTDPFGLARRTTDVAPVADLTVYPRVDAVHPLPDSPGSDRHLNAPRAAFGVAGEDFYALRPYEVGDDLRRVHWPSTARRDELMIRQNETPWQGRATVLLDTRARFHTELVVRGGGVGRGQRADRLLAPALAHPAHHHRRRRLGVRHWPGPPGARCSAGWP